MTVGGEGCTLAIPGVAPGTVLAQAEWMGIRGILTLRPGHGFKMRVNGEEMDGGATYRLRQPLQFVNAADGTTYDVTLYAGKTGEIGFGTAPIAVGKEGSFPGTGDVNLSNGHGAFGSFPGTASGQGIDTNAYI